MPKISHISVCVCTFKRPLQLARLLQHLILQKDDRFDISVSIADNDRAQSARQTVAKFSALSPIPITYSTEPEQNIALARNRALLNAHGDYIAFIDDDEFPSPKWLTLLFDSCTLPGVSGVLGPVRPYFDHAPPKWLIEGRFCERAEYPTGTALDWRDTRTGNVLFRREIISGLSEPFRPIFPNGGEDQDFFKRMIEKGNRFIWCNDAAVFEAVPPERWTKRYFLTRAFLRGQNERYHLSARNIAKSLVAVPSYLLLLPILFLIRQQYFVKVSIRLMDHVGRLCALFRLRPLGNKYLGT